MENCRLVDQVSVGVVADAAKQCGVQRVVLVSSQLVCAHTRKHFSLLAVPSCWHQLPPRGITGLPACQHTVTAGPRRSALDRGVPRGRRQKALSLR